MNQVTVAFPWVGILTLTFVVLKLTGVIAWSWWWVLSPLWISVGLGLAVIILILAAAALGALMLHRSRR